jgi:hypothetical protein
MKNILKLLILFMFVSFLTNCLGTPEEPAVHQEPIFEGTKQLFLYYENSTFTFTKPDVCKTYVLAVFGKKIITSGKKITNTEDWKGGTRTGLTNFSLDGIPISELYQFPTGGNDYNDISFTTSEDPANPPADHFTIWCFAEDWSIPYSSEQYGTTNTNYTSVPVPTP